MRRKEWILLALRAASEHSLQPVQLQKSLFIVGQSGRKPKKFYVFEAYDYGPFSRLIYEDADELRKEDLISRIAEVDSNWSSYMLTEKGADLALKLDSSAPIESWKYLQNVVKWVEGLSFKELVKSVYAHYPEYRINSVFKD